MSETSIKLQGTVFLQERRMQQQRKALLKEKETAEKIAARAFAQSYLADLIPSVFSTLNEHGFFYDPIERGKQCIYMCVLILNLCEYIIIELIGNCTLNYCILSIRVFYILCFLLICETK